MLVLTKGAERDALRLFWLCALADVAGAALLVAPKVGESGRAAIFDVKRDSS